MKTKIKRLSKSTVSLLLTLMMLFSCVTSSGAVTIKPESAPTTVDETAVNENTVEETIGDETAVGETAVDETPAQTDENTVTVDIEPEDVQTTVLTEEEIKGEQVEENTVLEEYSDKGNLGKKSPEKSKLEKSDTIYFLNIVGLTNVSLYNYNSNNKTTTVIPMTPVSDGSLIYSCQLTNAVRLSSHSECAIFRSKKGNDEWWWQTSDLKFDGTNANNTFVPSSTITNRSGIWTTYSEASAAIADTGTKTVYFDRTCFEVSKTWTNIYAYTYISVTNGSIPRNGYWPGTMMDAETEDLFCITVPSNAEKILFNDGSNDGKTSDITLPTNIDSNCIVYHKKTDNTVEWEDFSDYATSVHVKTIYFDDKANWSLNSDKTRKKLFIYVKNSTTNAQLNAWPGVELSLDKDHPGLYSFSTTEKWTWFKITDNTDDHITGQFTFVDGKVYNNDGITSQTLAESTYYPISESTLTGTATDVDNLARVYYVNTQNDLMNTGGTIKTSNFKTVQKQTDKNGRVWYFVDFTKNEVNGNNGHLYFVAANSSGTALNTTTSMIVKTSNDIALGSGINNKDSAYYFAETWTKRVVTGVRVYLNAVDSNFYRYTVVPNSSSSGYVHVVAKDGTIRPGDGDNGYMKYAAFADTQIIEVDEVHRDGSSITVNDNYSVSISDDYNYNNNTYRAESADIKIGSKVQIRTRIYNYSDGNEENLREKYYVKAFNVNGETYFPTNTTKSNPVNDSGEYKCEFTIPSTYTESDSIEITPVFFYNEALTSSRKYITFIVENYVDDVVKEWGKRIDGTDGISILSCYAWYGEGQDQFNGIARNKPCLGGYPGQPMVYENGHYIMQVPKANDDNETIQGVTMNNYIWDYVHCDLQGAGYDGFRESLNCQTYDYDDFSVLANETDAEFIVFRFKYETTKNPYTGTATTNRTFGNEPATESAEEVTLSDYDTDNNIGNGWEDYDDYYGNTIDLFNNILKNKDGTFESDTYKNNYQDKPYYVVSNGYEELYYGHFTTLWYVYDDSSDHKFVGAIPSSAFYYSGDMKNATRTEPKSWFMDNAIRTNYTTAQLNDQILSFWKVYYDLYQSALNHPVKITYETAIRAMDTGATIGTETVNGKNVNKKHPADPGLRCDGNWYYSKKIPFNAEIVVMYKNGNGDEFTDSFIRGGSKPYAGHVTNAKAYFTNKTYTYKDTSNENKTVNFPGYLDYNANNVYSSSDGFQFTANFFTEGYTDASHTTRQNYMFDGWYVDIDGVLSPLDYIVSENGKATASTADMRGYTKIVAKYVPYQVSDQNISELEITHELLKKVVDNRLSGQSVEAALETIIGTDGNKIMPHEDLFNTNTTVTVYGCTNANGTDGVEIGNYEDEDDHSKTKIQFDSNNSYTYLKIVLTSSHSNGNPTTNDFFYEENGSYYKSSEDANIYVTTKGTKANIVNGETCTYIIPVSNIYDNNKFKTNVLSFYSDPQKVIDVIIKYYDREVQDNTAAHISKTPTIYKINYSVAPYGTQGGNTEANFIADNTGIFEKFKGIDNILDKYKFWLSQEQALDANTGIKSMKFYRYAKDKSPGNDSTYGEFYSTLNDTSEHAKEFIVSGDSSYDSYIDNTTENDLQYHTMYNGLPQYKLTDNTTYTTDDDIQFYFDGENWVNYYSEYYSSDSDKTKWNGAPIQNYDRSKWSQVNAVVIWGYNAPKEYTFKAYYTPEQEGKTVVYDKSNKTAGTDEVLVNQNFIITAVDKATTYVHTYKDVDPETQSVLIDVTPNVSIKGFFNQRIGTPAGGRTDRSSYLVDYGIETALFGDSGTSNGTEVLAPETVKYKAESAQTAVDYEFDGWYIYDSLGFHKFSSEISYRERVVCNLTLYAGFVEKQQQTNTYHDERGLAVTWNGVDYLVDSDGEDKVRVNTEICVYGTEITESDKQITDIASIYFKLPTFGQIEGNGSVVPINWNDSANKAKLVEYFNKENGTYSKQLRKQILSHLQNLENFYSNGHDNSDYRTKDRNFSVTIAIENVNLTNPEPEREGQYGLVDCFSYRVYDSVDHPNEGTFKLTNKNRLQFVYKMLKTDYESQPFMAYVAMRCRNYSDSNGSRIYGNEHTWYLSDNFVSNCGIEDAKFILPTSYPPVDPVLGDDDTVEDHLAVIEEGASGTIVETDTFTSDLQNEISNETDQPTDEGNQTAQQNQDGLLEQQDSTLDNVPIDDSELVT